MSNISLGFSASLVFGAPIGRVVAAAYPVRSRNAQRQSEPIMVVMDKITSTYK
ncbi:hypothetical protein [Paenibacillus phytorum]|uniref:hypothetical protein n=1 Tax=Paenibacillus phytorum TaxID=2654977 RepID=UPI001491C8B8|nr:hypothetical protein [Paenibacillus phytorum]